MKSIQRMTLAILFGLLVGAAPSLAHHSAQAEFDTSKNVEVKGVLSKVDYDNPHCYYYIDVKGADGKVTTWSFEGQPPSFMHRGGITREYMLSLIGSSVTMSGFPAKDGTKAFGLGHDMTLESGKVIQIGPR